ncbi:hypothetical protein A3H09_01405 [Candidatus Falkowbacteria bacterium RIFCSPLOWO2_12_FULL_45_13]|uniref:Uncharacterized protein n=2 Tax=Candidatus Falkowiibacteriota TaxID=1752728 RepID=A0A1F5SBH4_9BACT|nr:MAG: hypothetical protein A3H66_01380 [Candidatus Falkowbacteria bacterium RIFCSPLOWO2_02_FULL_45_21]OGF32146.1 MAG: hypothetical protein A3H09_01405 [Candidatus Falkowbacteria bacterium RIFCSPLOWO2_12_FULL_45_13]
MALRELSSLIFYKTPPLLKGRGFRNQKPWQTLAHFVNSVYNLIIRLRDWRGRAKKFFVK